MRGDVEDLQAFADQALGSARRCSSLVGRADLVMPMPGHHNALNAVAALAVAGLCLTTEANLGDGVFPAVDYLAQGGVIGNLRRGFWSVAGAAVFARMYFIPVLSNALPATTRLQPRW